MVISTVTGSFKKFEGTAQSNGDDFENAQVEFTLDVDSIDTNQEQRDQHLKAEDFFNAAQFPQIKFQSTSFTKTGGSVGINFLLTELDLGDGWVNSKQIDFIRALMYVIKDMPQDLPEKTRRMAQTSLEVLLRRRA